VSRGDIIIRLPKEREFPFPPGGVKAASREDVLRLFPNGLPEDNFADFPRGLGISDTSPVRIYSFGPDTDESDGIQDRPEVYYDPTNGIVSEGDLFITLPRP
jgi:hypothetical protein